MEILGLINLPLWLIGIITIVVSSYLYSKWKQSFWKRNGVPGPEPTPFLGNLGQIRKQGLWRHTLECRRKYGKVFGTYFGNIPNINIADADLIKELTVKRFSIFSNRYRPLIPPDEQRGMLTNATNEHWKYIRNTLTATFSSGKMRQTSPAVANCCEKLVENIKEKSNDGKEAVEIKHIFGCFTMDVIASTGFGIDVNSQKDPDNEFVKQAKKAFNVDFASGLVLVMIIFPVFNRIINFLTKINVGRDPFSEVFKFFKKVTLSIIEERKSAPEIQKRKDLMQIMLNSHNEEVDTEDKANMVDYKDGESTRKGKGLTIDEVVANSFIFFLAGYDTTANTLSFLAYNLAMNPECQEKCIEEVDKVLGKSKPDYDNVLKLQYLDNCMNETLRIYGPATIAFVHKWYKKFSDEWTVKTKQGPKKRGNATVLQTRTNRKSEEECDIGGYKVPKGISVNLCIYAIHHDPDYWPDPEKFDPDRFSQEEKEKRHPYAFLPFGHGPRNCIGMRLAQLEAKGAIASILQNYRLVKCEETEDPVVLDNATGLVRAKNGIKLKVQPRN